MSDRLTEIEERLNKVTTEDSSFLNYYVAIHAEQGSIADEKFVAHAPTDIRFLLDEVKNLRENENLARETIEEAAETLQVVKASLQAKDAKIEELEKELRSS